MTSFLDKILPRRGFYCAARLSPKGGFIHTFYPNIAALKEFLHAADAAGHTMYVAQATFSEVAVQNHEYNKSLPRTLTTEEYKKLRKEERTSANTLLFRNFFFDIDCGPEKFERDPNHSYPTQLDGAKALRAFCHDTGLPFPALVNSGNGLYAHWLLSEDVPADKWKALALVLKRVAEAHAFKADPMRTADAASVLRPVGTHNRKGELKKVKVLDDKMHPISLERFAAILETAAKAKKVSAVALAAPTQFKGINDEFTAGIEGPPSSALKIAEKCAQIRAMRDSKGDIPEPVWYAAIGVLRHCTEGDGLIHEWSEGHADYSPAVTQGKIDHHRESGSGPTTCAKFGSDNPSGCLACPHANRIKSPITLGYPELQTIEEPETAEAPSLTPTGFTRTENGLFWTEENAAPVRFYPYDLYPVKIAFDASLGYETLTLRHQLPVSKVYKEFAVRSSLIHDPKNLLMSLADNHVQVSGKESRNLMCAYIDRYMAKLREQKDMAVLHSQMGWQKGENLSHVFVLGESVYREDADEETAGFARNIPEVAKCFHAKGDLDEWRKATKYLGLPGMEPLAFAFLAGGFGAPLMRFTGFAGAVVALVGRSGIGKTLVGEWALSVYGEPTKLVLLKNDTTNGLISRLGLYGTLPLYLDEVSNIEGQELSDLLYRITQGRDKVRLNRDARERAVLNSWNTIALASSNHSLVDKLAALKSDASAEINRVMEIACRPVESFGREQATPCYHTFHRNYGVAGPVYVKYLVDHQHEHHEKLDALINKISALCRAQSDERFWTAMSAVAIYGGLIAQKLNLIDFSVAPILSWLTDQIVAMRETKIDCIVEQVDIIGQFLDTHAANILITANDKDGPKHIPSILREPRGAIVARIQSDQGVLYVSRAELKKYLDRHYGSYTELKLELERIGALKDSNCRKILGSGTYIGGTQQPCWKVDLNCAELGRRTLHVVQALAPGLPRVAGQTKGEA